MSLNRTNSLRDGLIKNIRGDGSSEVQRSAFLNLAPKYYLWIYLAFLGSYLTSQFVIHNFILQAFLLAVMVNVPGQAIMKFRVIQLKEPFLNFFLGIVLSLISIMGFFFLITVILPVIGISRPLNRPFVGVFANLLVAASLFICSYARNAGASQDGRPSLGNTQIRHWVYGAIIIFFGFHSVTRLNAGNGDFESIAFTFLVFFLMISLFLNRRVYENDTLTQILLFSLCLEALVAVSFRGDGGLNGVDINKEYANAAYVISSAQWSPGESTSPYHAMLSVTILPAILSLVTKFSLTTIFKLFYVVIAALFPGVMALFLKRYVRPQFAIAAVLILIVGSLSYLGNLPGLARQIIGTAFFIAILIIIFDGSWSISRRKRFVAFLTIGLSFSHYSTAYLFAGTVLVASIAYTAAVVADSFNLQASGSVDRAISVHRNRVFTLPFVFALLAIILIWNGGITKSAGNIQEAVRTLSSGNQQLNLLGSKNKNIVLGYLQANSASNSKFSAADYRTAVLITNYSSNPDLQTRTESLTYDMVPSTIANPPLPLGKGFANLVSLGVNIQKLGYQLIIVSVSICGLYIFYRSRREEGNSETIGDAQNPRFGSAALKSVQNFIQRKGLGDSLYELFGLTFAGVLLAVFIRSSSFIGNFYNTDRAAFQISLLWLLPFALFFEIIYQFQRFRFAVMLTLSIFAAGTLFTQLGLGTAFNGTYVSKISSVNSIADATVISAEENFSAEWVCQRLQGKDLLQLDSIASVNFGKYSCPFKFLSNVSPFVLDQGAFIFSNRPNTLSGVVYDGFLFRRFKFPLDYIEQYYAPVYASDTTRLYH